MKTAHRIVAVFAKQPRAGTVKTRLAADVGPDMAARLAEAFLLDTLEKVRSLPARRFIVHAPSSARDYFVSLARSDFKAVPQRDGDLGERLRGFLADVASPLECAGQPLPATILLGSDSPSLPREYLEQAWRELENAEVVLGPATDGGYYLLGCTRRMPPLFDGIAWSTADVLAQTCRKAADAALKVALLPPWYDVDTVEDLRFLRGHLAALHAAGHDHDAPHTAKVLAEWDASAQRRY